MKIKHTVLIVGIVALLALCVRAQDTTSLYRKSEFSIAGFGTARTSDFATSRLGYGVGVSYFLTRQLGAEVEARWERLDVAPAIGLSGVYRFPIFGTGTAPYVFAGGDYLNLNETWGIHVGAGLEHRFTPNIGVFGDARLQKDVTGSSSPSEALARVGLRFAF